MTKLEKGYLVRYFLVWVCACFLYRTGVIGLLVVLAAAGLIVPKLLYYRRQKALHLQRFEQMGQYMEQMQSSFWMNGKILVALQETEMVMEDGLLKERIGAACDVINMSLSEQNLYEEAFSKIEEVYANDRAHNMHSFFIQVESYGGEYKPFLNLLIEDCSHWMERTQLLQKDVQQMFYKVLAALGLSMVMCAVGDYLLPFEPAGAIAVMTKAVSVGFILVVLFVYLFGNKKVTIDWLRQNETAAEKQMEEYTRRLQKYEETKSHPLGRKMILKTLRKNIISVFPYWLMQVGLLLQRNNVQMAIAQTIPSAPTVLKRDLEQMVGQFELQPEGVGPYQQFLKRFQNKEISVSMKTLYSISELGHEEGQRQIEMLLERNQKMLEQSDKMKNENMLAGMVALYLLPMLIGGVKLLVDMTLFLLSFFQNISM